MRRRRGVRGRSTGPPLSAAAARRGGQPATRAEPNPSAPDRDAPTPDDAPPAAALPWETAWQAPLDDARTRLEINLAIAESAMRSQRPRNPYFDEAARRRAHATDPIIRTGDDEAAWAALEPLTASGVILHLVDFARANGGVFSAQSLLGLRRTAVGRRLSRNMPPPPRSEPLAESR